MAEGATGTTVALGSSVNAEKGRRHVLPKPGKDSKSLITSTDNKPNLLLLYQGSNTSKEGKQGIYLTKIYVIHIDWLNKLVLSC